MFNHKYKLIKHINDHLYDEFDLCESHGETMKSKKAISSLTEDLYLEIITSKEILKGAVYIAHRGSPGLKTFLGHVVKDDIDDMKRALQVVIEDYL